MRAPKTPAEDGSRGFVPGPWCAVRLAAVLSEQVSSASSCAAHTCKPHALAAHAWLVHRNQTLAMLPSRLPRRVYIIDTSFNAVRFCLLPSHMRWHCLLKTPKKPVACCNCWRLVLI